MKTSTVVAVLNSKGGVGKSMLAQHLASAAHLAGRKVLLIDLDSQGTSFEWFTKRADDSALSGITVVKADKPLPLKQFRLLAKSFDFVVCDGPARLADISVGAAVAADIVLIPMKVGRGEQWADKENHKAWAAADSLRAALDLPPVKRFYVLNELVANLNKNQKMIDELAQSQDAELLPLAIHRREVFERGLEVGETALTLEPKSAAANEIRNLYRIVMERRNAA